MGEVFSVPQSIDGATDAGIPPSPADLVPVRAGLDSFNGEIQAEDLPNPSGGEREYV